MSSSALRPGGSTSAWRRLRRVVLARDAGRCRVPRRDGQPCGRPASHVDHVVPRAAGGTDDLVNLRAACAPCNLARGDRGDPAPAAPARAWSW